MRRWSRWRPFPDPREGEPLTAPLGPGVYELRNRDTDQLILVGISGHCAHRMSSLLPRPLGTGTRNNAAKRTYVRRHLNDIDYRTLACPTRENAARVERERRDAHEYLYPT